MAYKLTIHDAALVELEETLSWYNKISPELSEEIGKKIREAVYTIWSNPLQNPKTVGGFRKLNLERFPYKLVYKVSPDEILIVAIAHHKRRPHYWKRR
jgi:plasmid stabilization system protein ParE